MEDDLHCSATKRRKLDGIGMNMMEKMGYRGGGLGKNEQGILNPIQVKLRAKNSGLGFNESNKTITENGEPVKKKGAFLNQKKKKKMKQKEVCVTDKGCLTNKQVHKIYDMRGPQIRVHTNLSDLNAEEKIKEKDITMPELRYNVALIVRLAEADIQEIDRNLRKEIDIALNLKTEKKKLEAEAEFQKKQLDNYENTMSLLDGIGEENALVDELIPKEFLANESIRYNLNCGLDMTNQAVEDMQVVQPDLKEKMEFETRQKAAASAQQQAAASLYDDAVNSDHVNEMSVKEVIEAYAQDHGLVFKLKPGRVHNGYQIYGFGNVSIIIDSLNQKVYARNEETWYLVTLQRLLELHIKSLSKRR